MPGPDAPRSVPPTSPLAEAAIATDLEGEGFEPDLSLTHDVSRNLAPEHSMASSYRRPSFVQPGFRPAVLPGAVSADNFLTPEERLQITKEERNLLRDSGIIPPRATRTTSEDNIGARLRSKLSLPGLRKSKSVSTTEEGEPSETSPLIGDAEGVVTQDGEDTPDIDKKWEEAVQAGLVKTTYRREAKVLARYSGPLILTFLLQYSLTVASIFTVGHIGKEELGAVSLASMTANITGYAVYHGLATSLDTLCAQAYGSGRRKLVGLQLQRMVFFLWAVTIPIGAIWLSGTWILTAAVPEKRTAALAGQYLKIILFGAPGYAAFESGKRFVQAQGLFDANLYVLLFCAPINAFLNWLFVWHFKWGFIGAPIAVTITDNLLPLCLFLYVYFIAGRECWGGFSKQALRNWWPMIKLALPGLVMILAEFLAFEILTLAASWISSSHLAAQSVLSTLAALTYQVPFSVSIAASTRIANLIGATLSDAAKTAARVDLIASVLVGIVNFTVLGGLRNYIPKLFTSDEDVIALVAGVLPLCAAFQLFDALACNCNGILRGLGRQDVGGYINLFAYYAIAMPISFGTGFGLHWDLYGLWAGPALALLLVFLMEAVFLYTTNWQRSVEDARLRNTMG